MATKLDEAPPAGRRLLTLREAAAYLGPGFTERWVKRQVYELKTIPAKHLPGRTVIEQRALDALVDDAPDKPTKKSQARARKARAQRAG